LTSAGVIGPLTWAAIVEQYGLLSGAVPASTALTSPAQAYPGSPLRIDSEGGSVRYIQGLLNDLRELYPSIPAVPDDGYFDQETENAVTAFQELTGLPADGIVGPDTWKMLTNMV